MSVERRGRRPRKSEQTRLAIIENALSFLWVHPFRELTVAKLMAGTGVSRPAFYQYFADLYELMEALLKGMQGEILASTRVWLQGQGEPVPLLHEALAGLVRVCYERGPILRAITDAAATDDRLEEIWGEFMASFDDAVAATIERQQRGGQIPPFPARPVAVALNRLDAALLIEQFGRQPRGSQEVAVAALTRIWTSTLYAMEIHL